MTDAVLKAWVDNELVRLTTIRAQEMRDRGTPGPEGSVVKLAYTVINQDTWELCVDLLGNDGLLISDYEMVRPTIMGGSALAEQENPDFTDFVKGFLTVRGSTIGGGTTDIGRNILGERVLGLPGDPRADKDLPWSQVPRS
jgi:alkylation response protein AidB-like acyl-CoA dehydrogenase